MNRLVIDLIPGCYLGLRLLRQQVWIPKVTAKVPVKAPLFAFPSYRMNPRCVVSRPPRLRAE